jgi:hypothetical protein
LAAATAAHSRRGTPWPGIAGLLLSVALLWWVLHDVSFADVWRHLRQVRPLPFALAVAFATATFPLRAVRWRYILRLEGALLPYAPLWHATAIGFMANNLLPARAGELARAYAARKLTAVRLSSALGSLVVERVLDGIAIVALLTLAIWAGGFTGEADVAGVPLATVARSGGAAFLVLLAAALAAVHWPEPGLRLARFVATRTIPERWADRLLHALRGVLSGLDALRSPVRFLAALLWTFGVWLVNAASFWLCAVAFGLSLPAVAAFVVQGLVAFGVAIPSSPGFFGPFEAACRVSLALYGVTADRAVSYAVGYHFATFIPITLLGLWSLSRAHLHLAELRGGEK